MKDILQYIVVPIVTALITAVITYLSTKVNNKTKMELAIKDHEIKLQELNNEMLLKDKEIEQLKLHHELELKSKEADIVNPIMGEFMKEIFKDPSKVNQLMELQNTIEVINSKGGVNMNSKDIYSLWMEAWNKDINAVNEIADDNCTVHQSRIDEQYSESLKGPNALKDIINSSKYYFKEYEMSLIVGPIVDKNYISARWNFTGVYDGISFMKQLEAF